MSKSHHHHHHHVSHSPDPTDANNSQICRRPPSLSPRASPTISLAPPPPFSDPSSSPISAPRAPERSLPPPAVLPSTPRSISSLVVAQPWLWDSPPRASFSTLALLLWRRRRVCARAPLFVSPLVHSRPRARTTTTTILLLLLYETTTTTTTTTRDTRASHPGIVRASSTSVPSPASASASSSCTTSGSSFITTTETETNAGRRRKNKKKSDAMRCGTDPRRRPASRRSVSCLKHIFKNNRQTLPFCTSQLHVTVCSYTYRHCAARQPTTP